MRYLKYKLEDGTQVKFKVRKLYPYGLNIAWKYTNKLNFCKYINLTKHERITYETIEFLQKISDKDFINNYKHLIEDEHRALSQIKRHI